MKKFTGLEYSLYYVVLIRAFSALASIFLMIHLGQVDNTILSMVLKSFSLAVGFSLFSIYGYNQMISRLAPTLLVEKEFGRIKKMLSDSLLVMFLVLSGLVGAILVLNVYVFDDWLAVDEIKAGGVIAVCLSILVNISALLRANNKKIIAVFSDSNFIFFIILLALTIKTQVETLSVLDLYQYVILVLLVVVLLVVCFNYGFLYKIFSSKSVSQRSLRKRQNAYYYISTVSGYMQQWGCITIGAMLLTESEIVGFSILQRFVLPISFVMTICNGYFAPVISRCWDRGDVYKVIRIFVKITRINFIFATIYCVCLLGYWLAIGHAKLPEVSMAFVLIMMAGQIVNVATGMSAVAANMMDLERDNAIINVVSIVSFLVTILLLSDYGVYALGMAVLLYQTVKGVSGYCVVRLKRGVKVSAFT